MCITHNHEISEVETLKKSSILFTRIEKKCILKMFTNAKKLIEKKSILKMFTNKRKLINFPCNFLNEIVIFRAATGIAMNKQRDERPMSFGLISNVLLSSRFPSYRAQKFLTFKLVLTYFEK